MQCCEAAFKNVCQKGWNCHFLVKHYRTALPYSAPARPPASYYLSAVYQALLNVYYHSLTISGQQSFSNGRLDGVFWNAHAQGLRHRGRAHSGPYFSVLFGGKTCRWSGIALCSGGSGRRLLVWVVSAWSKRASIDPQLLVCKDGYIVTTDSHILTTDSHSWTTESHSCKKSARKVNWNIEKIFWPKWQ